MRFEKPQAWRFPGAEAQGGETAGTGASIEGGGYAFGHPGDSGYLYSLPPGYPHFGIPPLILHVTSCLTKPLPWI